MVKLDVIKKNIIKLNVRINNITERIYLKAGDPLIALVPYKKDTKISLNLSKSSKEFNDIQSKHNMISHSKSSDWYDYKKVINEEE